jgi:CubicO group peptidase (beta-lactamase class C family)
MATSGRSLGPSGDLADLLRAAVAARCFPAAAAEVGDSRTVLWRQPFGTLTFDADAPAATDQTIFDLASLTKPIATTTVVLDLLAGRALALDDRVSKFLPEWMGADRETATVQDLLEHSSGLAARLVDPPPGSRREFEHEICAMPLAYAPRAQALYSDLGFLLVGFLASDVGRRALGDQFRAVYERFGDLQPVSGDWLDYGVTPGHRDRIAPTLPLEEDVRRGRVLVGEVHDNYAALLGRVTGHSGLFGTAGAVGDFARLVLRSARGDAAIPAPLSPPLVARAIRKSAVPRSSRALGWDTMLPTSSCGSELSPAAFGHVGFTGTSLWIDPILDRYFVLLANRVCGGGTSEEMQLVRRAFHDAAAKL